MRSSRVHGKTLREYMGLYGKGFAVALAMIFLLMPAEVYAACSAAGLFTLGDGTGKCTGGNGVFANILCTFESILGEVLGRMYCAFQDQLKNPIATTLSIATAVFGVCVYTGYIQMSVGQMFTTLVKLALIWALAMNSDYGILWIGKFFMGILQEGTNIAISPLGGNATLTQPDSVLKGFFNFMSNPDVTQLMNASGGGAGTNNCGPGTPCMNETMLKNFSACAAFLMTVGVGLMVFMPIIIVFLLTVIIQYIGLYVRAVLGYLTSVVILTFMFIFAPLFLSFYLFAVTRKLFERWLQFLQTFSLQAIILFSFLALLGVATQGFTIFLYNLLGLMRPYDVALSISDYKITTPNACSVCEFKITPLSNGMQQIECLPAIKVVPTTPKALNPSNFGPTPGYPNDVQGVSIGTYYGEQTLKNMYGDVLSSQINTMPGNPKQDAGSNYVIPITGLIQRTDFVIYFLSNAIAFIVIATVFQEFIKKAPDLARALGAVSGAGVAALGGRTQGNDGGIHYFGENAFAAGMKGMNNNLLRDPFNAKITLAQRLKEGIVGRKMVGGRQSFPTAGAYEHAMKNAPLEGGMIGGFLYGAETNVDSNYYAQERYIKEAVKQEAEAREELKQAHERYVAAQSELTKNAQAIAVAEEEAKKTNNYAQLAQLKNRHVALTSRYEEAQKKIEERKEILRKKAVYLDQERAELYRSPTREHGAVAVTDGRGNIVHRGLSDNPSLVGSRASRLDETKKDVTKERLSADYAKRNYSSTASDKGRVSSNSSQELIQTHQSVSKELDTLERQLAHQSHNVSESKRQEYQRIIDKARSSLGNAKTAKEAQSIMSDLAPVQADLSQFSSKYVMKSAAVVGLAGLAGYSALASKTASATHLQEADKTISAIERNLKDEPSEQTLGPVLEDINKKAPKALLGGMLNAVESQKNQAELLVPASTLAAESAKLKQVERDSVKAETPEENARLMEQVADTQADLMEKIFAAFDAKRDKAGNIVPEERLKTYDKKIADAKTDAAYAQKGEDIDKVLKDLFEAPNLLLEGVVDQLKEKFEAQSASMPPQERQHATEKLREAEKSLRVARDGDQNEAFFDSLYSLNDRLVAAKEADNRYMQSQSAAAPLAAAAPAPTAKPDYTGFGGTLREAGANIAAAVPPAYSMRGNSEILGTQVGGGAFAGQDPLPAMDDKTRKQVEAIEKAAKDAQRGIPTKGVMENLTDRIKAAPVLMPTTMQNDSTIMGAPAGKGIAGAMDQTAGLLKASVPDMSKTTARNDSTLFGSPAAGGLSGALQNLGDRAKNLAPNTSKSTLKNDSTLFGAPLADGAKSAGINVSERLKASAPDFERTRAEVTASLFGSSFRSAPPSPTPVTDSPATPTPFESRYVAEWQKADPTQQAVIAQQKLETTQTHFSAIAPLLPEKERKGYADELARMATDLKNAKTSEDVKALVQRLAAMEASYAPELPEALNKKAGERIQSLEKAIAVGGGLIHPDSLKAIQEKVNTAKSELSQASTTRHYDRILDILADAQRIITG